MGISRWIPSIILFVIGMIFWSVTYIAAPLASRKYGRYVSGFAGVPFILFAAAGLLSPCKRLILLCLLDFSIVLLPYIIITGKPPFTGRRK